MNQQINELKIFHEIKNSITIIECSVKLMAKTHPEVVTFDYWDNVMDEFRYLKSMIGTFSTASANVSTPKIHSLESIVAKVIHTLHPITENSNFNCKFSIADNLPDLYVDADRLKSCVINIIKNAYEAMNKSGTVYINIQNENNYVRMDIQDFGGGIPAELESHIFEPYFTSKENGSGLGLPLTKQLITEMGGNISCTSRPGDGCTFSLFLPVFAKDKHLV